MDPLGGFERIRDLYISYLDTAFRVRRPELMQARGDLLRRPGTLTTEPFLEPVLRYQTSDHSLEQLVDDDADANPLAKMSTEGRRAFVELALSGLFAGERSGGKLVRRSLFKPYRHQLDMPARGIKPGRPGIVTSGTGSGKTEAFMLPIFAALAEEATRWPAPDAGYLASSWWGDAAPRSARIGRRNTRAGRRQCGRSCCTR